MGPVVSAAVEHPCSIALGGTSATFQSSLMMGTAEPQVCSVLVISATPVVTRRFCSHA